MGKSVAKIVVKGQAIDVTEDGRIFGKRKELKQRLDSDGYPTVTVGVKGRRGWKVHRLVALTYIPNPEYLETVNHKDDNKLNNHYTNLEWCTRVRNVKLAQDEPVVAKCMFGSGFGYYYPSQAAAHRDGFTQANISKCVNGERPSHKGYNWSKV